MTNAIQVVSLCFKAHWISLEDETYKTQDSLISVYMINAYILAQNSRIVKNWDPLKLILRILINEFFQTSGLGGLRHNAVVLGWPDHWKQENQWHVAHNFVHIIRTITAAQCVICLFLLNSHMNFRCAILVPKNAHDYPPTGTKVTGNIDVW